MKYEYSIVHEEDFEPHVTSDEGIDNEREGILALARANENEDGFKFVLLRSNTHTNAWVLQGGKWVRYC